MNRINKVKLIGLVFCLILVQTVNAQRDLKKTGQSTMTFLNVGISAHAAGIGDAFLNVGTGAVSMFYNPSALVEMETEFDFFLATTRWLADINYYAGSFAYNLGNIGTFSISVLSLDYGVINGTQLGPFDPVTGANYSETGQVPNVGAYAVGLGYARWISDKFNMGGNVMIVGHQLGTHPNPVVGDQEAQKLTFNFGLKYFPGILESFRFGMNIRNFGTSVEYEYVEAQMPVSFALGLAADLFEMISSEYDAKANSLTLSAQFEHPNDYTERVLIGAEYGYGGSFFFRTGYKFNYDLEGFSAGLGLKLGISGYYFKVDYSYTPIEFIDDVHRFSMNFIF